MNPSRVIETQCTHAQFLQELPKACGNRPYEIIDNTVIVHDADKQIRITVHDESIRHLGSLTLPMEKATFEFIGFTESEADEFMKEYRMHSVRVGGG
jgi:hypothetical protein